VESNLDRVVRAEIRPDATAGPPEVFAEGLVTVPDGMALDAHGNLYETTYGSSCIYRATPRHEVALVCQDVGNEFLSLVTNCAFARPNFDQLIAVNLGHTHLLVLDLRVKGQPLWNYRGQSDRSYIRRRKSAHGPGGVSFRGTEESPSGCARGKETSARPFGRRGDLNMTRFEIRDDFPRCV
jgi:hypothetical protein